MTPTHRHILRTSLWLVFCISMFHPCLSLALNGDDWVLVQRFQTQLKSAQAGKPSAMYEVAWMYEFGRGTEPDPDKAVQWYERAISKGQNNARAQLGVMYFDGSGVKRDLRKALSLLKPAAEKGDATAQYYLGQMYEQGAGLRHDQNQAIYWYKLAAGNGYYLAIDRLKTLQRRQASATRSATTSPSRQAPAQADSPALVLMRTVMQAKWQKNGKPSGFLPSSTTHCQRQKNKVVICRSGTQKSRTYDAEVSYYTDATLSGFDNADAFQVTYVNTVLKVNPIVRHQLDGSTTSRRPPNIPLGRQSVTHTVRCELKSVNQLSCLKDNNLTDTFNRAK